MPIEFYYLFGLICAALIIVAISVICPDKEIRIVGQIKDKHK